MSNTRMLGEASASTEDTDEPDGLRLVDIHRRFGGVHALRGAGLDLRAGEIHGLIGQNGSGKSTLLGILSGQLQPDDGRIIIDGRAVTLAPHTAARLGIAMVSQETSLVADLTVGENVFLGHRKPRRRLGIQWRQLHQLAQTHLSRLELDVDSRTIVRSLRLDQQQLVEITRAIATQARVLVLDEPTSSLSEHAVEVLLAVIRRLRDVGMAIVIVSHRLDELMRVSDRITVMRDGRTMATKATSEWTARTLAAEMTPDVEAPAPRVTERAAARRAALRIRGLNVPGRLALDTLDLSSGETIGLYGLAGSGCTELLEALFGLHPMSNGALQDLDRDTRPTPLPGSPLEAMRRRIAYVPSDRKTGGLVLDLSLGDNLHLPGTAFRRRWRTVSRQHETHQAASAIDDFRIATSGVRQPVTALSGGNQQKVLLAKWLTTDPKLLLLDEPTRGVDVVAQAQIHALLRDGRREQMATIIASTDIAELTALCDRYLVLARGTVVAELDRDAASPRLLAELASGGVDD